MTTRYVHWPRRRSPSCRRAATIGAAIGLMSGMAIGATLAAVISEQNTKTLHAVHATYPPDDEDYIPLTEFAIQELNRAVDAGVLDAAVVNTVFELDMDERLPMDSWARTYEFVPVVEEGVDQDLSWEEIQAKYDMKESR